MSKQCRIALPLIQCCFNFLCLLRCQTDRYIPRPQGYKTFSMLNSNEHTDKIKKLFVLSLSEIEFIMLINVKMPTIVFMSRINFVLS